jgi:predicted RNA methylase
MVQGITYMLGDMRKKPSSLLRCLLRVLGRGVFVDVGAYIGFYTVLATRHGWRVVAFEPNPINLILIEV